MKGVSDVIAMLLMLVITIGLVSLTYTYIMGIFSSKTAVTLEIIGEECNSTTITVMVKNHGTAASGTVTLSVTAPNGAKACSNNPSVSSIRPGEEVRLYCSRVAGQGPGNYRLLVSTAGSRINGISYCTS